MIHYDLQCDKGHEFDGWFASSSAFDKQLDRSLVTCTVCGSVKVEKQLMAPGIPQKSNAKADAPMRMGGGAELMKLMRDYRRHVDANSEDVGTRFAEEARKIHYQETEDRGIRGSATREEAVSLLEEGIDVHPLPVLPEDTN